IYLDGYGDDSTFVEVENVTDYYLFGEFNIPTTVTMSVMGEGGEEQIHGVPIIWTNWSDPTAAEIEAGKFTRNFKLLTGGDTVYAQEFNIKKDFTIEGLGNYGELSYHLTADNYFNGLPTSSVLTVEDMTVPVTLYWNVTYGLDGFTDKTTVTVTSEYLIFSFDVALTVDGITIEGISDGNGGVQSAFMFDPYGVEGNLFASGELVNVSLAGGGTAQFYANYDLKDIYSTVKGIGSDKEFYANISKFFGKAYPVRVSYTYPDMDGAVDGGIISVYVVDRTVYYAGNHEYRTIFFDPYIHSGDLSHLATSFNVITRLDRNMTVNSFKAYFDWTSLATLIRQVQNKVPGAGDPLKYMATAMVYVEDNSATAGLYVFADITDDGVENPKYITLEAYEDYMQAQCEEGETFINDKQTYRRVEQKFNLPVTILDRTVVSSELVLTKAFEELYVEEKYATITRTIVGVDELGEHTDGRYMDIVKSKSTGLPTQMVFYNRYSYVGEEGLPKQIRLSYANGDVMTYKMTLENVPSFEMLNETAGIIKQNVKATIWNNGEAITEFTMEFVIRASALTVYNTNITYKDMSVGDYRYNFAPYVSASDNKNLFRTQNYDNQITYYVDGQFVSASAWWNEGREIGETVTYNAAWTKRHAMYSVYGGPFY
ncbi:MAG: hypothetical protein K2N18_00285, partial [Clostridia bacterium]|nr:hypothetical protein [Clostridia bacterium]